MNDESRKTIKDSDRSADPIYFDYAATTPVDPRVAAAMMTCLTPDGVFANPASVSHAPGRNAMHQVDRARAQIARDINCAAEELVFTSGATESDNLAIKGVARTALAKNRRHIVTGKTEHKAVIDTCKQLENEGFKVTYLVPDSSGVVGADQVRNAIREDTCLVSLMHVNNEIGSVNPIADIGLVCEQEGVPFHVDAAQSIGKIALDLAALKVDLMSFSAHKAYGPKGVGALFVSRALNTVIEPIIHGGGHEKGMRSGTLATHQIVGMGEAFKMAGKLLEQEDVRLQGLRKRLLDGISSIDELYVNGDPSNCVPSIVNVSIAHIEGESLLYALRGLALSSGSACTSATTESSYVLRALGRSDQLAQSSIRISFGRFTTEPQVDKAVQLIKQQVQRLRAVGPVGGSSATHRASS